MSLLVIHLALITLGFYLLLLLFFLFVYLFVLLFVFLSYFFFVCFFFLAKQKKLPVLDITAFFFCIPTHAKKETRYIFFFNSTVSLTYFHTFIKKKSTNIHIVYPSFRYLVFDLTICGI